MNAVTKINHQIKVWDGHNIIEPQIFDMSSGKFYNDWREFEDGWAITVEAILNPSGLKDKNGIEYYTGDVLDNKEVVEFRDGCYFAGGTPLALSAEHREIVGTIYKSE